MSSEFLMILTASAPENVDNTARSLMRALSERDFHNITYFDEVSFDPLDSAFEVLDRFGSDDIMRPSARLDWKLKIGVGTGFTGTLVSQGLTIRILFGSVAGAVNCSIGIPGGDFRSQAQDGTLGNLFSLYCHAARSIEAVGGFGGMDYDDVFVSPDSLLDTLGNDPLNRGFPPSLSIVSKDIVQRSEILHLTNDRVYVLDWNDYWIVEDKDFVEVYSLIAP